jgi:large subunit ribosomal protein L14e
MKGIEIGSVCIKTRGRSAGKLAVIVDLDGKGFATVDGKELKRKRCNLRHLMPTGKKIDIKKSTSHEEVLKKLE